MAVLDTKQPFLAVFTVGGHCQMRPSGPPDQREGEPRGGAQVPPAKVSTWVHDAGRHVHGGVRGGVYPTGGGTGGFTPPRGGSGGSPPEVVLVLKTTVSGSVHQ